MKKRPEPPPSTVGRRELLRRTAASLTLKAAGTLSPFLLAGCHKVSAPLTPKVKVGLLHSQTGSMSMLESSLRDAELQAIEEINATGGVLGHTIDPVVKDTHSSFTDIFPRKAKELLSEDDVTTVFGCWTSSSRKAVQPLFERFNGLLFYPLQYEGNESSYCTIYSGSVPNQQVIPAVDWLVSSEGGSKRRFYMIGAGRTFPWTVHHVLESYIPHLDVPDVEIVGYHYTPMGVRDFTDTVKHIRDSEADVIFSTINGSSNRHFFTELAKQGVSSETTPVLSTSVGEDELRGMKPEHVSGHFSAWHYFQSLDTPRNRRFVRRFQSEHGDDRVLSDPMEAAYSQVYLWKAAAERANSFDVDAIRDALSTNVEFHGPGGKVTIDPKTFHVSKRCRVGRIRDDRQFDIVYESPTEIAPDPYPELAFPGWSCDWSRGGLTQGKAVRISRPIDARA